MIYVYDEFCLAITRRLHTQLTYHSDLGKNSLPITRRLHTQLTYHSDLGKNSLPITRRLHTQLTYHSDLGKNSLPITRRLHTKLTYHGDLGIHFRPSCSTNSQTSVSAGISRCHSWYLQHTISLYRRRGHLPLTFTPLYLDVQISLW